MKNVDKAIELLEGTSVAETLKAIMEFYGTTQGELDDFVKGTSISCPRGCGSCCERFMPDITEAEALAVAAFIVFSDSPKAHRKKLESARGMKTGPCPLYNPDSPFHCTVYEARPLICRLFASSCFPDKDDEASFSPCHLNKDFKGISKEELRKFPGHKPIMGHYGFSIRDLEGNSEKTEFLPEAILKAIDLLEYYLSIIYPEPNCS